MSFAGERPARPYRFDDFGERVDCAIVLNTYLEATG